MSSQKTKSMRRFKYLTIEFHEEKPPKVQNGVLLAETNLLGEERGLENTRTKEDWLRRLEEANEGARKFIEKHYELPTN